MKPTRPLFLSLALFAWMGPLTGLLWAQDADPVTPEERPKTVVVEDAETPMVTTNDMEAAEDKGRGIRREAIVLIGSDAVLKAGESCEAVVVIGGNAKIQGKVDNAVVVIGGDIDVDGGVIGDAAVSVMGMIHARNNARFRGDVVIVGGRLDATDEVKIARQPIEIDLGGVGIGLRDWVIHCLFKLRPLAPQVGFVWVFALFFFLLYLLVAVFLPRPVAACVDELTRRPATAFFLGLLTKLLIPLVIALLGVTVVGLIVVPFLLAALVFGGIVGKVALVESMGLGLGRQFGGSALQKPLLAFLVGIAILTLLYMVPVLGLITFLVVSVWGLGGAVTATFTNLKRETPPKPTPPDAAAPIAPGSVPVAAGIAAGPSPAATTAETATAAGSTATGPVNEPGTFPQASPASPIFSGAPAIPVPEALAYPKASFWERLGAAFLDLVLLGLVTGFVGRPPWSFLIALAYFAGMWAWKGTTIGGIVVGLKVVRLDGQPVSITVAIVRGLAAAFSAVVFFLGILWIAWDRDKQGWHDKIAGTIVVKLPRGTPLVCL